MGELGSIKRASNRVCRGGLRDPVECAKQQHLVWSSRWSPTQAHARPFACETFSCQARYAVTGAADCAISILGLSLGGVPEESFGSTSQLAIPVTSESMGSGGISSLALRADGKLLAAGGWDKRVRVWQARKWKPLAVLNQHTSTVNAVDFSMCSRWLASASNDRTVALWSIFPPSVQ